MLLNAKCVLISSTTFVCNISDSKRNIIENVYWYVMYPLFLSDFKEN